MQVQKIGGKMLALTWLEEMLTNLVMAGAGKVDQALPVGVARNQVEVKPTTSLNWAQPHIRHGRPLNWDSWQDGCQFQVHIYKWAPT